MAEPNSAGSDPGTNSAGSLTAFHLFHRSFTQLRETGIIKCYKLYNLARRLTDRKVERGGMAFPRSQSDKVRSETSVSGWLM